MRQANSEYYRRWYVKNRAKKIALVAEWKRNNPEKALAHARAIKERKTGRIIIPRAYMCNYPPRPSTEQKAELLKNWWDSFPQEKQIKIERVFWSMAICQNQISPAMRKYYQNHAENKERSRKNALALYHRRKAQGQSARAFIASRLRTRIWVVLRRTKAIKSAGFWEMLGCTGDELRSHLESKFDSTMNWNNYGSHWHVDHIRPCASFDLTREDEQRACFHFTNLQPLEKRENRRKWASYPLPR